MTKRSAVLLFAVVLILGTAPIFAQTTCQDVNGPGPLVGTQFECNTSGPSSSLSHNYTYYGPSQDSMCYLYPSNGLYRSDGSYGSGNGDYTFTAPSVYYYDIRVILDLNNTHFHAGDRFAVVVYNDDDYTAENLGTIYGSGGDICSGTYNFYAIRPGWAGKHMRVSLQSLFQDNDSNSKVGYLSISVFDRQTW